MGLPLKSSGAKIVTMPLGSRIPILNWPWSRQLLDLPWFIISPLSYSPFRRNMHDFRATLYQQTCGPMDIANRLYFNGEKTHFEVGFLFKNGCNSTTVKFDTNANISLGHQMQLSSAVLLKLWASFDGKNKLQESCKVGIGINLNFWFKLYCLLKSNEFLDFVN